jgi:NAD(P)-dependent dehydrogenase (short-subunit alcohol dehydrogenase family)
MMNGNDIEAWPLELGSFDSVRKFADQVEQEDLTIDALIANAGLSTMTFMKTQDGWETTFVYTQHRTIYALTRNLGL